MSKLIYILNGPNLNLLGKREPEIYGNTTLEDVEKACVAKAAELGCQAQCFQSNFEGQLVDWIHEARENAAAVVINPGAYSHTSSALLDGRTAFEGPVIEGHISNIHQRESFRHHSYVSLRANGVIVGLGAQGYDLAIQAAAELIGA